MRRRVLLVGATGVFGARLAAMLSGLADLDLVLAARGAAALNALRDQLEGGAPKAALSVQTFDRAHPEGLGALRPWLVIDAAGPFQESGYALPLAAVAAGAHYVDLADARAFVANFPGAVNPAASAAGVLAVTGASSTPALSHAVLHALTDEWSTLDEVLVVISPGARAPRGLAVVRAILSYVGRPVRLFQHGRWSEAPGWSGLRRVEMPGLGRRWASICETPDLDLLPARFPVVRSALFMAGLELAPMHLGLALLGWLVRLRLMGSLTPLARPLRAVAGWLAPFGSDRGGMIVQADGRDANGLPIRARWALVAEANAGPNTPAAPAAALVRALLQGEEAHRGAMSAAGLLSAAAIVRELEGHPIATVRHEAHPSSLSLYRRLLGRDFETLPAPVRRVHASEGRAGFSGEAIARGGRSLVARLSRLALGLPRSGRSTVRVTITPDPTGEVWTRRFGASAFSSRLADGRRLGVFQERFGPIRFDFELQPTSRGVLWRPIGWRLLGVPLPSGLAPRIKAGARAEGDRYRFSVVVAHPWVGLLFAYRGLLG